MICCCTGSCCCSSQCWACSGSGMVPRYGYGCCPTQWVTCSICHGSGRIWSQPTWTSPIKPMFWSDAKADARYARGL